MDKAPLSVTIITLNEEENISRAIQSVSWADEIVVVDSGSSDRTVEIARSAGATVIHNPWPGYGKQKNFAQSKARNHWVLNIDADEEVSPELARDIQQAIRKTGDAHGYYFPRKTFYLGRWIRHGGWYPNHLVRLVDRRHAAWTEPSVHETLRVHGPVTGLSGDLLHYAFRSIHEQILTNLNFSKLGSQDLQRKGQDPSLVKLMIKPLGKFIETYFIKRGFLDGLAGFIISVNAAHSMFLKYAYLLEGRLGKSHETPHHR